MPKVTPSGRPSLQRHAVAGGNLRIALKVLGKTWRRDLNNPSHVLNWEKWTEGDLPRSPTTIDRDIREGIPENRLSGYAQCLGVLPETLASPNTDMVKVLSEQGAPLETGPPSLVLGYRNSFPDRYLEHNRESYISDLFALMKGVYRVYYVLHGVEPVHRCTIWIHGTEAYRLLLRGRFTMFGKENLFNANMFRWHNNLHTHFLSENGLEFGYFMSVDPLRHNLVMRRDPFWLKGHGLTDRGLADNAPISFIFRMEKLTPPQGMSLRQLWEQESEAVRKRPYIAPGEPDHTELWAGMLATDELI